MRARATYSYQCVQYFRVSKQWYDCQCLYRYKNQKQYTQRFHLIQSPFHCQTVQCLLSLSYLQYRVSRLSIKKLKYYYIIATRTFSGVSFIRGLSYNKDWLCLFFFSFFFFSVRFISEFSCLGKDKYKNKKHMHKTTATTTKTSKTSTKTTPKTTYTYL